MKYGDMTVEQFLEASNDPRFVREFWTEILINRRVDDVDNPCSECPEADIQYYRQYIEMIVENFSLIWERPENKCIQIAGEEYEWETSEERSVLFWIRESVKKGLEFREACLRAIALAKRSAGINYLIYEWIPASDDLEREFWIERMEKQGINTDEAQSLATEIVRLVRQEYLIRVYFYFYDELYSEEDRAVGAALVEKLTQPQYSDAYTDERIWRNLLKMA
jgi:hypothetical protein